jgi:hypothetical protein
VSAYDPTALKILEATMVLELARHWMQAAVPSEGKVAVLQK